MSETGNQTPRRSKLGPLYFLMLTSFLGGVGGCIYGSNSEPIFQSEAKFQVEMQSRTEFLNSDFSSFCKIRHDRLIGQYNVVSRTLTQNQLTNLRSFAELPEDKIIPLVISNLVASQDPEEPTLFTVTLCSSRADDAQTILNNLIGTYTRDLEEEYRQVFGNRMSNRDHKWNLQLTEESLKEAESKNQSDAVIAAFQKLESELLVKLLESQFLPMDDPMKVQTLQNATYGEPVWPILHRVIGWGAVVGFAGGLVMLVLSMVVRWASLPD